jgi:proteasome lid subunit RPN8/RPN11
MWKIKRNVLLDLLDAAKITHPNEFASLLGGEPNTQTISEFVVPPVISNNHSASINLFALPMDKSIIGSIHSHPSHNKLPSFADKKMFQRYPINIILCHPYTIEDFAGYDSNGTSLELTIID